MTRSVGLFFFIGKAFRFLCVNLVNFSIIVLKDRLQEKKNPYYCPWLLLSCLALLSRFSLFL